MSDGGDGGEFRETQLSDDIERICLCASVYIQYENIGKVCLLLL